MFDDQDDGIIDIRKFTRGNLAVAPEYVDKEFASLSTGDARKKKRTPREEALSDEHENHTADPIMCYADIEKVIDFMLSAGKFRDACLFVFGICTGLRISDLVRLKFKDVCNCISFTGAPGTKNRSAAVSFRSSIDIHEKKTGKRTVSNVDEMIITEAMQKYFSLYMEHYPQTYETTEETHLFPSRKGRGMNPLSESQGYLAITEAIRGAGLTIHAGTHTMRKTFLNIANAMASASSLSNGSGGTALSDCQILARHSNPNTTLRYMNAAKTRVTSLRKAVSDFVLGRTKVKDLNVQYEWETEDDE